MDQSGDSHRTRRSLLKSVVTMTAATAAGTAFTEKAAAFTPRVFPIPREVIVYRFKVRKTVACNACKIHHRYIIGRTRRRLNKNRAHKGCNCPIIPQAITTTLFRRLFPTGSKGIAHLPRGD